MDAFKDTSDLVAYFYRLGRGRYPELVEQFGPEAADEMMDRLSAIQAVFKNYPPEHFDGDAFDAWPLVREMIVSAAPELSEASIEAIGKAYILVYR